MSEALTSTDLPFACCDHCDCTPHDRTGHDDTCRTCQAPDGTPMSTSESTQPMTHTPTDAQDLIGKIVRDTTVTDQDVMYLVGTGGFMTLGTGVYTFYDSAFPGPTYFARPEFETVETPHHHAQRTTTDDSRWTVEVAPAFRQDNGPLEDVGAQSVDIEAGCLVFRTDNHIVYARAAGTWLTLTPEHGSENNDRG